MRMRAKHTKVIVLIKEFFVGIKVTWLNKAIDVVLIQRGEIISAVIVVVLHSLRLLVDGDLHSCFFELTSASLLTFFGVCGITRQ